MTVIDGAAFCGAAAFGAPVAGCAFGVSVAGCAFGVSVAGCAFGAGAAVSGGSVRFAGAGSAAFAFAARPSPLGGALAPVLASVVTAAVLVGGLWVQRQGQGWPFSNSAERAVAAPSPVAGATDMAGMDMSGEKAGNPPSRVPIDVTAETLQTLGVQIQPVRREALTDTIQAVATVAPPR